MKLPAEGTFEMTVQRQDSARLESGVQYTASEISTQNGSPPQQEYESVNQEVEISYFHYPT